MRLIRPNIALYGGLLYAEHVDDFRSCESAAHLAKFDSRGSSRRVIKENFGIKHGCIATLHNIGGSCGVSSGSNDADHPAQHSG